MRILVLILFSGLTVGAGLLTYYDVGADRPKVERKSLRQGSAGHVRYHSK
ncbi:MAG: hypothetical protein GY703_12060 [Gammaproteobacteria bacterium]|nr:hypothetical protein [Gammaproteobacteria bacterium]